MSQIKLKNIDKTYIDKKILNNVSMEVEEGDIVGLLGRNGSGKTTLLKIITGKEKPDNGIVTINPSAKIGYLEQMVGDEYKNKKAIDVLKIPFKSLITIQREMRDLEKLMGEGNAGEDVLIKYGNLSEEFNAKNGYQIEMKIARVTNGLNISNNLLDRSYNNLSGGEKTQVLLAKLLLEEPDILLLDEPTNHLDIKTLSWLEGYIKGYKGTTIIVSHDRYFLDNVVNKIYELDETGISKYNGNYSFYHLEREKRYLSRLKTFLTQKGKIDKMQEQVDRFLASNSEGLHRKAHEIEGRINKIEKLEKPILTRKVMDLSLINNERTGKIVLEFSGLSQGFEDILFEDVSGNIYYQDSICIIGENGSGKSTLLKTLLEEVEPLEGKITWGSNLEIGYLDQSTAFSKEDQTILDFFQEECNLSMTEARKMLAKMLFKQDSVYKKIATISGGEKSRLKLATIMQKKPNILILDEPTNHFDLESREIIEEELIDYPGTVLFVSHDRYFINKIATKIWELEDKKLEKYDTGYEGYMKLKSAPDGSIYKK